MIHRHAYKARHATPFSAQRAREATAASLTHEPRHAADPELVVTRFTGHGVNHGNYPADIRGIA